MTGGVLLSGWGRAQESPGRVWRQRAPRKGMREVQQMAGHLRPNLGGLGPRGRHQGVPPSPATALGWVQGQCVPEGILPAADAARMGQRRDPPPNLEPGFYLLLPVAFSLSPRPLSPLISLSASLSCGLIWELPQLMSSPGSRACRPSCRGEAFTPPGPVF